MNKPTSGRPVPAGRLSRVSRLGGMAHFLDHEDRGVLIQRLVDRDHHAHLHQHLDHFTRLDSHQLGQIGHGDCLWHGYFPGDWGGRT